MTGETCEHLWSPPAATGRYCMLCDAKMLGSEPGMATVSERGIVQSAPAEMPGVEDIARAIYHGKPRKTPWDALPHEFKNQYRKQARAVLALFAPILAEKERDIRQLKLEVAEERETSRISIYGWRDKANEMEACALAAEAALAAERERCIAIVDAQVPDWVKERSGPYWDGYREAMEDAAEDMRKGAPDRAAAIRAEGE